MKRKKKGSSLILVMVVFAIISILGTSMLGVTMADYKMRIEENKKTQGLYNSEAGIDVSLNIIAKMIEVAISKGNEAADKINIPGSKDEIYIAKNEAFKTAYINYLYEKIDIKLKESSDGVERLKYCLDNGLWITKDDEKQVVEYSNNYNKPEIESTIVQSVSMKNSNVTEELLVKITSEFSDEANINRILETEYSIIVPEYQSVAKSTIAIHPILNNLFAIHGNAYLSGNININGDVFVGGEEQKQIEQDKYDIVYNKYDNGIRINDEKDGQLIINSEPTEINITGKLITPRSLYSSSNATINVDGDIYAGNVYLGKKSSNDIDATKIKLQPKDGKEFNMYLSNDLALNANESSIELNRFYGLSDINHKTEDDKESLERVSSSIIVNSQLESNQEILTIKDEAWILGTAYINTTGKYQTGESIAIKGNYIAYTSDLGNKDIEFIYDDPLQLINKIDHKVLDVFDKATHIKNYYEKNGEGIQFSGIKLPDDPEKIKSIGAYINSGSVKDSNTTIETISSDIEGLRKDFVINTLNLGVADSTNYTEDFYKGIPRKTVGGSEETRQINFNEIKNVNVGSQNIEEFNDNVILNNDAKKKVIIIGSGANNVTKSPEDIVIDISTQNSNIKLSGLIITAGDVEVYGEVDFNGAIISGGDFVSNFDNNKKTFTENLNLVQKLIAENAENLTGVFKENEITDSSQVIVTIEAVDQYNINNYIENKLWKIVK